MKVIAFVGESGTGKSYRSINVSRKYGADAIIDDGILISQGKVIAGTSAKREDTRLASVRHALFMNPNQAAEIKSALVKYDIQCVMILGTSDGMVRKIASNIGLSEIERYIRIEEEATQKEMELARRMRTAEGKHVIPVPTFEIKQDFSGYFLHPLRRFQKNLDTQTKTGEADKSIVRPTFSYMGNYTISNNVIISIATHEAMKTDGVVQIHNINLRTTNHGVHIDMTLTLLYGGNIHQICGTVQQSVRDNVEKYTSVNTRRVNILVKSLKLEN